MVNVMMVVTIMCDDGVGVACGDGDCDREVINYNILEQLLGL